VIHDGRVVEVREPGRIPLRLIVTDRLPIGRAGDGLLLDDFRISRQHCELRLEGELLSVRDLDSSNGTFVNGERLDREARPLDPGDIVTIGETTITVDPEEMEDADTVARALRETTSIDLAKYRGEVADATQQATRDVTREAAVPGQRRAPNPFKDSIRASVVGGTITMLFSDIVDSTALNASLGDTVWFDLLGRHNEIIRYEESRYRGMEVKAQGDGFLLTFPSARHALLFAISVQRSLEAERQRDPSFVLHVRIGIHTGEVIQQEGDLFGRHVNMAARVSGVAQSDEILGSSLVHELAFPMGDVTFSAPRTVMLKGFEGEHFVYPVNWR
jgi:class 3 adenylate cyclase